MVLKITGINKSFGDLVLYKDFTVEFEDNKVTCLIGPSGCGKTTLLNIIAGMVKPESGLVTGLDGRRVSYIFQEPRLLPWKTVRGNLEFALKDIYSKNECDSVVDRFLDLVCLKEFADRYPKELSGGMKQRVSIARAFAYPSGILLMDEPFKALDLKLKAELIEAFRKLWLKDRRTVLFVTHEVEEALQLGERIYVLTGTPTQIVELLDNAGNNQVQKNREKIHALLYL